MSFTLDEKPVEDRGAAADRVAMEIEPPADSQSTPLPSAPPNPGASVAPPGFESLEPQARVGGAPGGGGPVSPIRFGSAVLAAVVAVFVAVNFLAPAEKVDAAAIVEATSRTLEHGSAQILMRMGIDAAELDGRIEVELEGVSDFGSQRMAMTLRATELPSLDDMPFGADELETEARGDGLDLYLRNDLFSSGLPPGKSWLHIDLARMSRMMGFDLEALTANASAGSQLDFFAGATGDFTKRGTERVHGVQTTHYSGVVDMRVPPPGMSASERRAFRRSIRALERLGSDPLSPVEVWIDEQGLARRMQHAAPIDSSTGESAEMQMVIEIVALSDEPARIDMPSPAQTIDVLDLLPPGALREMSAAATATSF